MTTEKETSPFELASHCLLFLDIMGQKDKLRSRTKIPENSEEEKDILRIIQETLGVVLKSRHFFKDFFSNALHHQVQTLQSLPEDHRRLAKKLMNLELSYNGFSDSIVISLCLKNEDEHCTPMNGIHAVLVAACGMICTSLARGYAVRGGIDVGLGIILDNREVYGPVLERAYHLENSWAGYPRVLVGQELTDYLSEVKEQPSSTPFSIMAKTAAKASEELLIRDTDKQVMLHFLGPGMLKLGDTYKKTVVIPAFKTVKSAHIKWNACNNLKLSMRYGLLLSYFERFLPLWDIDPSSIT